MNLRKIRTSKKGFTLVEIAIVMVIIGLLIGGVLKGQAMIQNAKVKRVAKQADELRAAVMSFYDKYGMYPGDENIAAIPPGADAEGNGTGQINAGGEDTDFYRRLIRNGRSVRWLPDAIIYHRILADKLRRGYFLDLHYNQGMIEGAHKRGGLSRIPPAYLFGQLLRAGRSAIGHRLKQGKNHSLRKEMNFLGESIQFQWCVKLMLFR